jgi:hypothetical protein
MTDSTSRFLSENGKSNKIDEIANYFSPECNQYAGAKPGAKLACGGCEAALEAEKND